jgi:hypothetical protein
LAVLYLNLTYNNIYISLGSGFLYSPHTRNSDADATTTNMEELLKLAPLLLAAIHYNNNDDDGDNVQVKFTTGSGLQNLHFTCHT